MPSCEENHRIPQNGVSIMNINISQSVAILVDGNNIERSIQDLSRNKTSLINFDSLVPKLLGNRGLNRLVYCREGKISKVSEMLHHFFMARLPKSADIPLSIKATQLASKSIRSSCLEILITLNLLDTCLKVCALKSPRSRRRPLFN